MLLACVVVGTELNLTEGRPSRLVMDLRVDSTGVILMDTSWAGAGPLPWRSGTSAAVRPVCCLRRSPKRWAVCPKMGDVCTSGCDQAAAGLVQMPEGTLLTALLPCWYQGKAGFGSSYLCEAIDQQGGSQGEAGSAGRDPHVVQHRHIAA